jgi:hypothetical protein
MILSTYNPLKTIAILLSAWAIVSCVGCKSYQLGHPAELPFKTVYIQPVKNDSFVPQAQALISSQIREAVIRDGRVTLVADKKSADALLVVTLSDYTRRGGARRQNDTTLSRDFNLTLEAAVDLYDQKNGSFLFEGRKLTARSNAYLDNPYNAAAAPKTQGFVQSEYNAMPRIARDLGRKVADELLSAW